MGGNQYVARSLQCSGLLELYKPHAKGPFILLQAISPQSQFQLIRASLEEERMPTIRVKRMKRMFLMNVLLLLYCIILPVFWHFSLLYKLPF